MERPDTSVSNLAASTSAAFSNPATGQSVLNLRLTQSYAAQAFGTPVNVAVAVSKPPKAFFFRVHPGETNSAILNILDGNKLGADGQHAVGPDIAPLIQDQLRLTQLRLAVTSQGVPYLVPVPLAGPDGRINQWHQSLARAVELAETRWIRISANMYRGGYDVFEATGQLPQPQWPTESFEDLLEIAFRGRLITDENHPLVQQLLGA
jgi:hypothetical protein